MLRLKTRLEEELNGHKFYYMQHTLFEDSSLPLAKDQFLNKKIM